MSCIYKYKGKNYTKDEFYSLVRTTMVQPRTVQKYEKVLFPTGNTASKIEGHTTLEEFKEEKEDRIKTIEEIIKSIRYDLKFDFEKDKNYPNYINRDRNSYVKILETSTNVYYRALPKTSRHSKYFYPQDATKFRLKLDEIVDPTKDVITNYTLTGNTLANLLESSPREKGDKVFLLPKSMDLTSMTEYEIVGINTTKDGDLDVHSYTVKKVGETSLKDYNTASLIDKLFEVIPETAKDFIVEKSLISLIRKLQDGETQGVLSTYLNNIPINATYLPIREFIDSEGLAAKVKTKTELLEAVNNIPQASKFVVQQDLLAPLFEYDSEFAKNVATDIFYKTGYVAPFLPASEIIIKEDELTLKKAELAMKFVNRPSEPHENVRKLSNPSKDVIKGSFLEFTDGIYGYVYKVTAEEAFVYPLTNLTLMMVNSDMKSSEIENIYKNTPVC